jgi:hypothetical protein
VDDIRLRVDPPLQYVSRSKQLDADAIDAYVLETITALRTEHRAVGRPFARYHGCSKHDEQIVEVCLPTDGGDESLPEQEVVFTVARGPECDYPQILGAYDALVAYAAERGRELGPVPLETYLTEPNAPAPEMEISFPLVR